MLAQFDVALQPLSVRHQADLHEHTFQGEMMLVTGSAVGVVQAVDLAVFAGNFGGLPGRYNFHVLQAPQLPLQHLIRTHLGTELDQGHVADDSSQVDGRFHAGVTATDHRHTLALEQGAVTVGAVGHALVAVLFLTGHADLAPAGTGREHQAAGFQRRAIFQPDFVGHARARGRDQLLGTLHVHDIDVVLFYVLLHGRHQFRAFCVGHGDQVLDAHGVGHLATETLGGNTGRDTFPGSVNGGRGTGRATTNHQDLKGVFLVDLFGLFFAGAGVQPGDDLFQGHPALTPGLTIQVNAGHRHHFPLLHFLLEQGAVNRRVLDIRVQHTHQVQSLNHVRAVLTGQGKVGFKPELAFQ